MSILMSKFSELFSMYPRSKRPVEFCFSAGMLSVFHVTVWAEPLVHTVEASGVIIDGLQASSSTGWMGAAMATRERARAEKRDNTVLNISKS
jgi:hypothetical protein